jgi:cation diffusion facilitator family transporter
MDANDISTWNHGPDFMPDTSFAEKRTHKVILLTVVMNVVEIVAATMYHSMALLADGWRTSTHVAASVLAILAYYFGRRHTKDALFTFGTGKVSVLGAFASAITLSGIMLLIAAESLHRLLMPVTIYFRKAILIAAVGLAVNIAPATD